MHIISHLRLITFPGKVKDPERRSIWKNLVNRLDKDKKLWSPKTKSRVCSDHFDGHFPYPTKNLGYPSADEKVRHLFPERFSKRRKLDYNAQPSSSNQLRILIEQAIRNIKGFKFLCNEIPITLLPIMDDVVTVCGALVNLRKPIMTD